MNNMTKLESLIKSQEIEVLQRSKLVTEALNAKHYANKNNVELIAQLSQDIEVAQARHSLAIQNLIDLYKHAQNVEMVKVNA